MESSTSLSIGSTVIVDGRTYVRQYVACYHRILWEDIDGGVFCKELPGIVASTRDSDHVTVIIEHDNERNGTWLTGDESPERHEGDSGCEVCCYGSADGKVIYVQGTSYRNWEQDAGATDWVRSFIDAHAAAGYPRHEESDTSNC